jgi:hypothetical protein
MYVILSIIIFIASRKRERCLIVVFFIFCFFFCGVVLLNGNQTSIPLVMDGMQVNMPLSGATLGGTLDLSTLDCMDTKISYQPNTIYINVNTSGYATI